jgi:5-methylcytosine-specific restriction endonuclease McrBC GTP-binding regulatory subunit McrB
MIGEIGKSEKRMKVRARFDYRGEGKQGRVFSRGKEGEQVAEEVREQKTIVLRNLPIQGVRIEEINIDSEIYTVRDEISNKDVAYAPVEVVLDTDSIEDLIPFLLRDEFRKIEVLAPDEIVLDKHEVERIIYRISEEMRNYQSFLERRLAVR